MHLLKEIGLLVLTPEEFEECTPHLKAAGYRWLPCGDGFETCRGKRRQWQNPSGKWVSDQDEGGRRYLDAECLPFVVTVSNARDLFREFFAGTLLLPDQPFNPDDVRRAIKANEAWPGACG